MNWYEGILELDTLHWSRDEEVSQSESYIEDNRKGNSVYPNILNTEDLVVQISGGKSPMLWIYYRAPNS